LELLLLFVSLESRIFESTETGNNSSIASRSCWGVCNIVPVIVVDAAADVVVVAVFKVQEDATTGMVENDGFDFLLLATDLLFLLSLDLLPIAGIRKEDRDCRRGANCRSSILFFL
jgi:hypothetical protein